MDHIGIMCWEASIELLERVFFIRYEDLKKEPCFHTKRLAEFLGLPFSTDKEGESLVSKLVELCSFKNLSNLDVNKIGSHSGFGFLVIENKIFFREGQIDDSQNYLESEMMDHLDQVTEERFKKFHLTAFSSEDDEKSDVSIAMQF
ncbi:flavonol 4'-sulfotransferase-like [Coffea arabica]|uniref:Sulfotransferase n=1 Tax=Coffea arabica TaxID=13443 RepID=A0A6P6UZP8_COFAR|nr:flavonol 4'-sulfotransferase-like [Coffea arabica]